MTNTSRRGLLGALAVSGLAAGTYVFTVTHNGTVEATGTLTVTQ